MNSEDGFLPDVAIVVVLVAAVWLFGSIGPIASDWILK
jgi:hypothetical protein